MRVLVTAASKHGATWDIAQLLADELTDLGLDAVAARPEDVLSVDPYDAVVVGSAVYVGRWMPAARTFVQQNSAALGRRPVWLFSSGPAGDPPKPEGDPVDVAELMSLSGAREHHVFGGRIDRHLLGIGERLAVTAVRASGGDFRSPADVSAWAAHIARSLAVIAPPAVA